MQISKAIFDPLSKELGVDNIEAYEKSIGERQQVPYKLWIVLFVEGPSLLTYYSLSCRRCLAALSCLAQTRASMQSVEA